jgi:hypothetical protein
MAIRGGTIYYCAWKEVDSTIISPNFWMLVVIVFRPASNLYDSFAVVKLSLLTSACKHVSCDKQAQLMVADLSPPISVDNIQLNLKQKINIKGRRIRGCSFLLLYLLYLYIYYVQIQMIQQRYCYLWYKLYHKYRILPDNYLHGYGHCWHGD